MLHSHFFYGISYALRFIQIIFSWATGSNCTKRATPRAYVSKDHERGRARTPTLSHVWAVAAFANGVKFIFINQFSNLRILRPNRQLHPEPLRFAFFLFGGYAG